jgi:sugar transferase EpsL
VSRIVALVALAVLSPVLAVISLGVWLTMGRPILFAQERSGLDGVPFSIYKFRTMRRPRHRDESDADRITRFGRFLRSTSLDELPSLWNLLRGDMVLVGPRPFIARYAALYTPEQARRLTVKPGLTGWQQINGRNRSTWAEKFEMDVWYIDHRSWWLDCKIVLRTPFALLRSGDLSHGGHATMPAFDEDQCGASPPWPADDPQ